MPAESGILQVNCVRGYARRWRTNMLKAESPSQYIERLSALPTRKRLEEFRAIPDPAVRRQVAEGLPPELHGEMLAESAVENLNRNVRNRLGRQKPSQAA
jgi:hypothetical protein